MSTEKTDNDAKKAGGFLKEKATIALSRVTKDEVIRAIIKTTTSELEVPNEKHMLRLIKATYGDYDSGSTNYENVNLSIVEELEKKTHSRDWVVVLKAFLTLFRLMTHGSSSFNKELHAHRRIFCGAYIKDLADTPDGAAQQRIIDQFSRYIEERLCAEAAVGFNCRLETEEFAVLLCSIDDVAQLTPKMHPLLQQLEALVTVEYSDHVVSNAATLLVFENLIREAKRLYVVLTDRIKTYLDVFDRKDVKTKKQIREVYGRYDSLIRKLSRMFQDMRSGNRHFQSDIPDLQPMPLSLLDDMDVAILENRGAAPAVATATPPEVQQLPKDFLKEESTGAGGATAVNPPPPVSTTQQQETSRQIEILPSEQEQPATRTNRLSDIFSPTVVSAPHHNATAPTNLFEEESPESSLRPAGSNTSAQPPVDLFGPGSTSTTTGGPQHQKAAAPTPDLFSVPTKASTTTQQPQQQPQQPQQPDIFPAASSSSSSAIQKQDSFMSSVFTFTAAANPPPPQAPNTAQQPQPSNQPGGFDPFAPTPLQHTTTNPQRQSPSAQGPVDFFANPQQSSHNGSHRPSYTTTPQPGTTGNSSTAPDVDPLTGKQRAW